MYQAVQFQLKVIFLAVLFYQGRIYMQANVLEMGISKGIPQVAVGGCTFQHSTQGKIFDGLHKMTVQLN